MLASQITFPARLAHRNSLLPILLRTLCRSQRPQLLWNQRNPHSFRKTPGVWVPSATPPRVRVSAFVIVPLRFSHPLFSSSYKCLFPQPLSYHIHAKPQGVGRERTLSPADRKGKLVQGRNS